MDLQSLILRIASKNSSQRSDCQYLLKGSLALHLPVFSSFTVSMYSPWSSKWATAIIPNKSIFGYEFYWLHWYLESPWLSYLHFNASERVHVTITFKKRSFWIKCEVNTSSKVDKFQSNVLPALRSPRMLEFITRKLVVNTRMKT